MGTPTKKSTRHRKKNRAAHFSLAALSLGECSHCHKAIRTHRVCPYCGYYQGQAVIKVLTKEEKKKAKEAKAKAKSERKPAKKK